MKTRTILLAVTLGLATPGASHLALAQSGGASQKSATPLGAEILMFERAVKWDVVSPKWVERRPGWIGSTARSTDPNQLATAVSLLETNMGWSSVQPAWRERRDGWLA